MKFRSTFAKSALAGVAGVMALSAAATVPTYAAAQSSSYYNGVNGGYYDPCRRDSTNRGTVGALLGGALGAAIGANAAAKNARTEGALLGGALGAVGGAAVGKNSAACNDSGYRTSRPSYYDNQTYGNRYGDRSDNGYYAGSYDRDDRYYDDQPAYAYDRRGTRYSVAQSPGADGCTLAESPIYLPDGRVQKRFVRVCQDASGNYQVVD